MKFLSDILAKAGLTVDGVVTLNNTATGQTPNANDNSTKLATTAWVRTFVQPYSLPIASASVLGGIKVGSGLSINSGTGVLSVVGASAASIKSTQTFVVTEGQTVFTVIGGYTPGLIDIFLNGIYLSPNQTVATNGTTFTINDPAATGDIVDVIVASAIFEGSAATTDQLPEGSINLYYTNARARAAISLTTNGVSGAATYNTSTGVFNIPNYQGLVPAGGVAGDILAKVSGTNYDVTWIPNYTSQVQHIVKAGVAVTKGQAVYVSSADGTNMIVSKASNTSEGTSSKTLGLVAQDLAINGQGFVVTEGLLAGLNTSTAQAGDPVWLGTDGNLIYGLANKPYAPAHLVFIGVVTRVQQNNGEIFVKVQNGFELQELHNVQITTTPSDNTVLSYETSTSLYKMKSIATLLGYTPANAARTLTINGTSYDLTADRTWNVGTVTSVAALTIGTSGTDITSTVANSTTTPVITLNVPDASAFARGVITTGIQTIAGGKYFSDNVAIGHTSPFDVSQFSLDVNGGLLVKNSSKTAQFVLINSNPALGGNNAFVVHTVGGSSGTSYADIQGYYGTSIAGSTVLRLNPQGGNVLIGNLAGTGNRMVVASATGVLSTQAIQTLSDLSGVPTARTLTINGVTFDLSANRSWTINSMVYPSAGIAVSTGTAWGTSITDNSSNWNTAFSWGNHASAGYATTTYVNTQVANLVASAPATLDTLNELAAALGNDAAFSTTVTTALGNRLRIDTASQGLTSTQQGYGRTNLGLGSLATLSSIGNSYITDLAYSKLTSVPTSFTPSAHTHVWADITDRPTNLSAFTNGPGYITSSSSITGTSYGLLSPNGGTVVASDSAFPSTANTMIHTLGLGPSSNDGHILAFSWTSTATYGAQIYIDTDPTDTMAIRTRSAAGVWTSWKTILHSGNYNSYSPTLTGGGASGTWGINVTGTAGSETLSTVTSRGSSTSSTITSTNNLGLYVNSGGASYIGINSTSNWSYVSHLNNGSTIWDIGAYNGGQYEFRPYGGSNNRVTIQLNGQFSVNNSQNQVALFQSGNPNTWVDIVSTAGTWSMGATASNTWAIYNRSGTNGTRFEVSTSAAWVNGTQVVTNSGTWGISISGNASTASQIINNTDGAVLMESNASENNNWLWKENSKAWGLFWFNRGSQSGQTIGSYSTVGAEVMFMGGSSGIAMPTNWTGYYSGSYIAAMISNYNGYIYSASTVYAATDVRSARFYSLNSTGTMFSHGSMTDALGYNASYGTYIGSAVGGTYYLYANGTFYDAGTVRTLIHSGNIGSQSVSYASSAGSASNATTLAGIGISTIRGGISSNNYDFYVNGDANTYYPVVLSLGGQFGMHRYSISRGYSDPAPWDPIGTGSHRGGLTLTFDASSDIAWGGNDKSWRIIQFAEQYTNMVAGMALPVTDGIIVWLRGGGAYYRFHGPSGINHSATVYYSGYTAANGAVYSVRTNLNNVDSEIRSKWPVRGYGDGDIYVNNNAVIHAGGGTITGDLVFNNLKCSADQTYGFIGRNVYADTINGRGSDPLELCYYDGGPVKIGSGTNGSKSLYASGLYDDGNRVWSASNAPDSRYSRKDTTSQWMKPYYEYSNWLTTESPSTLTSQMGGGGLRVDFMNGPTGSGDWSHVITWSGYNRYSMCQIGSNYYTNDHRLWYRQTNYHNDSWLGWKEFVFANSAPSFGGLSSSGTITVTADNTWGLRLNRSNTSTYIGITYSTGGTLRWYAGLREDGTNTYRLYNFATTINALSVDESGNVTAYADVTAYSDARVKKDISPITTALEKTLLLKGVSYKRTDIEQNTTKIGFIAQDVKDVLPEVVTYDQGADRYGVSYGNITALLVEAIKEQQTQIESQKSEIEELKDLVKQLINR